jgi:hypothetical protein
MRHKLFLFCIITILFSCQNSRQPMPGIPDRSPGMDVLPGFRNPPPGYGQVPFWWWTGDTLNTERLVWQVRELHKKGISGVQVNYSHYDTPGWLTEYDDPAIFSGEWWKVFSKVSDVCAELDMGIGLSTYTLDWPQGARNLFYELFYHKTELNAVEIRHGVIQRMMGGDSISVALTVDPITVRSHSWADADHENQVIPLRIAIRAYPVIEGKIQTDGTDLSGFVFSNQLNWIAPEGEWAVWEFLSVRHPGSLNPLMPGAGQTVIDGFYQQFEDRTPGRSSGGLNYFFNDELHVGVGKFAWNHDFAKEFLERKGYDLFDFLPAMWEDIGDITPKVRMDYADVRMSLMEERYFKPIYEWHSHRGMIFGCDSESRGLNPHEFGDYFRATRWYSAPGHDTPGGRADLIKGKVSSSIANLYQRPRVWLEGYHSLGWGATPEQLMFATRENYLYGCTLLNLHGLYYTTFGSYYEWAPPCYHFRMPYWEHMDVFLGYFDRLSYLLSQGHFVSDIAVIYPVAPYEAEMDGEKSRDAAFDLGRRLMEAGINFEFIDNESLSRAVVEDGLLKVKEAGTAYRALVFPDMAAVRWPTIEKAVAFAQDGGHVYCVGELPSVSDRAGRNDAELEIMNGLAFKPGSRMDAGEQVVNAIRSAFVQDVRGIGQTVRALHRKAGPRDIYMVMDAGPGTVVEFRAKGSVELWDPWTGNTSPLHVVEETATGTKVELPLNEYEANIVVFTPGQEHVNPPAVEDHIVKVKTLPDSWSVEFKPTMDNSWGDFRMPVTDDNKLIGLEARRFAWARENEVLSKTAMLPDTDDSKWEKKLHGFGTQFYVLGPVPAEVDIKQLEADLSHFRQVDPSVPVRIDGRRLAWRPYDFSWRYGKEGDQGHQGWHGLKRTVTSDFICLGKAVGGHNETRYVDEIAGASYFLWTSATVDQAVRAEIVFSSEPPDDKSHSSPILTPASIYVNGARVQDPGKGVNLTAGTNPLLVRYDQGGRGHFVLRRNDVPAPEEIQPLSMKWSDDEGVIPFDVTAGEKPAEWFRFITAPGTSAIRVPALGEAEAWIDGVPMIKENSGRFLPATVPSAASLVAIRVKSSRAGLSGGILIPEPVIVETNGSGVMTSGDWSQAGILNNYSGGVSYRTKITLTAEEAASALKLDLGRVAGTAEVLINGEEAGVRVAPPWKLDATGLLKEGENEIEILVYNTLSNHYQTIPSRYRGDPVSGLLEPVKLLVKFNNTEQVMEAHP